MGSGNVGSRSKLEGALRAPRAREAHHVRAHARPLARDIAEEPKEIFAVFGWSAGDSRVPEEARKTGFAGSTSFLPAFPARDAPLNIDIVTCHHSEYYRDSLQGKALDTEAPIPNSFPVVEAGAEFCFTLLITLSPARLNELRKSLDLSSGFDPLPRARDWLLHGLTELGIGAKTSAGYGWFRYDEEAQKRQVEAELARERAGDEERQRQAKA